MKPEISHYFGRPVTHIEEGAQDWKWTIVLEGNVRISNFDKRRTAAPDVEGLSLTGEADDGSYLIFSGQQISVTPDKLQIAVEGGGDPDTPEEDPLPADPSPERVAEGPETPLEGSGS